MNDFFIKTFLELDILPHTNIMLIKESINNLKAGKKLGWVYLKELADLLKICSIQCLKKDY